MLYIKKLPKEHQNLQDKDRLLKYKYLALYVLYSVESDSYKDKDTMLKLFCI